MDNQLVLSSRVRLARNYQDLPFDLTSRPEDAEVCLHRTVNALSLSGGPGDWSVVRVGALREAERQAMADNHIVSKTLLRFPETGAVLLNELQGVSVMVNEEDHLRIQAVRPGLDLIGAASACFRVDDALSRQVSFAFDSQLGYLTALPTNTGTGMRASLLFHLPMLTRKKQMGNVGQIVAKLGLNIRGVYGEGSDALGDVYLVSNQVTLGRSEQEIITTVTTVGHQLTEMENALRGKAFSEDAIHIEDGICRAWGLLRHARLMPLTEFYRHWSMVRLGAAMGLLPLSPSAVDPLLEDVQDAVLTMRLGGEATPLQLEECRADVVRRAIGAESKRPGR